MGLRGKHLDKFQWLWRRLKVVIISALSMVVDGWGNLGRRSGRCPDSEAVVVLPRFIVFAFSLSPFCLCCMRFFFFPRTYSPWFLFYFILRTPLYISACDTHRNTWIGLGISTYNSPRTCNRYAVESGHVRQGLSPSEIPRLGEKGWKKGWLILCKHMSSWIMQESLRLL